MLSKSERLRIFIERMDLAEPAGDEKEALDLLSNTLNEVEDEHTSIPYQPDEWMYDGRMYPPGSDNKRTFSKNVSRYRSINHNTLIGTNGSIKIVTITNNETLLDKPGLDEKKVGDL